MAAGLGLAMAAALASGGASLPALFTSDPAVLSLISGSVWVFVVGTQPINSLAFVWDGVVFGAGGFRFACFAMAAACAPAATLMLALGGGAQTPGGALSGVWAGLALVMALRWLTIAIPYRARAGPFAKLFPSSADGGGGEQQQPGGAPGKA